MASDKIVHRTVGHVVNDWVRNMHEILADDFLKKNVAQLN